jgi:hypothetical protein
VSSDHHAGFRIGHGLRLEAIDPILPMHLFWGTRQPTGSHELQLKPKVPVVEDFSPVVRIRRLEGLNVKSGAIASVKDSIPTQPDFHRNATAR